MSNSEKVFTGLIEMVDRDVSNLILGSESMAGATQSYVGSTKAHQDVFRDRGDVYRERIENVMNEEFIPRFVKMGYIAPGLEFKYAKRLEMSDKDQIALYSFLTDKYEVSSDEIEKNFGVVVGRQINLTEESAMPQKGNGGREGARQMTDEEYYRRYGHSREVKNFLRERR
jgi:hypothetical protein